MLILVRKKYTPWNNVALLNTIILEGLQQKLEGLEPLSPIAGDATEEMAYGLSNGHMTDDVTGPREVKFVTPIRLERDISKTAGETHDSSVPKDHQ